MKRCIKCGQEKPLDAFHNDKNRKDGKFPHCKVCVAEYQREWRQREETKSWFAAYIKEWHKRHPDWMKEHTQLLRKRHPERYRAMYTRQNKKPETRERKRRWDRSDRGKAVKRAYYQRESNKEKQRQYYAANSDSIRMKVKQWKHANRVRFALRDRARTEQINAAGSFTAAEWAIVCKAHNHRCAACGSEKRITIDHIVPISKGGSNTIDNLQPLCVSCNSRKHTKTIDYRTPEARDTVLQMLALVNGGSQEVA